MEITLGVPVRIGHDLHFLFMPRAHVPREFPLQCGNKITFEFLFGISVVGKIDYCKLDRLREIALMSVILEEIDIAHFPQLDTTAVLMIFDEMKTRQAKDVFSGNGQWNYAGDCSKARYF